MDVKNTIKSIEKMGFAEVDMILAPPIGSMLTAIGDYDVFDFIVIEKHVLENGMHRVKIVRS